MLSTAVKNIPVHPFFHVSRLPVFTKQQFGVIIPNYGLGAHVLSYKVLGRQVLAINREQPHNANDEIT